MRNKRDPVASSILVLACGVTVLLTGCGESAAPDTTRASSAALSTTRPPAPVHLGQKEFELALASRLSRSSAGLPRQTTPHGGGRIDLRDRFQHVSIVHKRADGAAETVCVTTPGELHAALGHGSQAGSQ
jgi:hypothetical protein